MVKSEPPAEEQSRAAQWLQIIVGTVVLLAVATLAYAVLLVITGLLPQVFWERFDFFGAEVVQVGVTAAIGMWLGTAAMKLAVPRVRRKSVFGIIATLMIVAVLGFVVGLSSRGSSASPEALVSSVVFLLMSGILLLDDNSWNALPGRKRS